MGSVIGQATGRAGKINPDCALVMGGTLKYQEAQGSSFRLMGYPPWRIGNLGYES